MRYLKCLSPEESCECRSRMGSNRFYLCFNFSELCSRNVLGCFKNTNIIRFFEILNMLYPPKGAAIAEPVWGTIDFSYVLFRSTKGTWNRDFRLWKKSAKMFYLVGGWMDGWVDGWMDGWLGGDNWPSIYFIFKYDNKQFTLIPKMCSKVAFANRIRSYEHFKFQI